MSDPADTPPRKPDLRIVGERLEDPPIVAGMAPPVVPAPAAPAPDPAPAPDARGLFRKPGEIFPNCPVQALGVEGATFFYLDMLGQLRLVTKHDRDTIRALFAMRSELLTANFPRYGKGEDGKPPRILGWNHEDCAAAMVRACAEKGVWSVFERVRGLGAWTDASGGLVLHCGDGVLHGGQWCEPGEIDGHVYPSAVRIPRPLDSADAARGADGLPELLGTWHWLRGGVDAHLLLGWIGAAMVGGALRWRPMVWITGDAGTGKSTLQEMVRHVMGGTGAILQATDTTEPGVRQFLMQSTIPVALDELEAEADNRKQHGIIKLARQASTGGVVLRGSTDHVGQEFRARSAFMFSSILTPPLIDQDISRIALLELLPLGPGRSAQPLDPRKLGLAGRGMRHRLVAGWTRLHETLELYRAALAAEGHDARGCDQFGTLLALADLVLHDAVPDPARCRQWAAKLSAATITDQTDRQADWQRMLAHLMSQKLDIFRSGQTLTVGRWLLAAAHLKTSPDPVEAAEMLEQIGLRVYGQRGDAWVAVANTHSGLARLFQDTHWWAGAGQKGVWAQAVKRIPGAEAAGLIRFDGSVSRATKFPLRAVPHLIDPDTPAPLAGPGFTAEDFA